MKKDKVTIIKVTQSYPSSGATQVTIETDGPRLERFAREQLLNKILAESMILEVRLG